MVAPSSKKIQTGAFAPASQSKLPSPLLGFLTTFAAHIGFRWVFIDSRGGSFPTFATGFRRLRSIVGEISRVRVS
jgi:hypothetical protein